MAPKRSRITSGNPPTPPPPQPNPAGFDDFRFMFLEAENFHNEKLALKAMVEERGIEVATTPIANQIRNRRWQKFCQQPIGGNATLVRQFYANYPYAQQGVLRIRGVNVPISRTKLNEYYGLNDNENSQYRTFAGGQFSVPLVYSTITSRAVNTMSINFRIAKLKLAQMTRITKAWHYFIIEKLIPSIHPSSCDSDKAVLNYAIQTGLTIDVGEIMDIEIKKARRFIRTGLYYPSAITAICYAAGVPALGTDELCEVRETELCAKPVDRP